MKRPFPCNNKKCIRNYDELLVCVFCQVQGAKDGSTGRASISETPGRQNEAEQKKWPHTISPCPDLSPLPDARGARVYLPIRKLARVQQVPARPQRLRAYSYPFRFLTYR